MLQGIMPVNRNVSLNAGVLVAYRLDTPQLALLYINRIQPDKVHFKHLL